jgi:cytidylate kinase
MSRVSAIVIDGPAAAGKSTVGRAVADSLGLRYLNTGDLFRAVAWVSLRRRPMLIDPVADLGRINVGQSGYVTIDGEEVGHALRQPEIGREAARLGHFPDVVVALMDLQRRVLIRGGYVADGRNLGSDVLTEAALKIYLTAMPEARALRRARQTGEQLHEVRAEIAHRDALDATRPVGALSVAEDAEVIDATWLPADDVVRRVVRLALTRGFGLFDSGPRAE